MKINRRIRVITTVGMLSAASFILMLMQFPAIPAYPWLKVSAADVPALISGFALGPVAGLITVIIRAFMHLLLISPNPVGHLADIVSSGTFIVTAAVVYRYRHSKTGALQGMLLGATAMAIVMVPVNVYVLIPMYLGAPDFPVGTYIAYGILPHNLVKGFVNALLAFLLYKRISRYIPHARH